MIAVSWADVIVPSLTSVSSAAPNIWLGSGIEPCAPLGGVPPSLGI